MTNHAPPRRAAAGLHARVLWTATACTIVGGYALLVAGATTLPAVLLVAGYMVLAPAAICGVRPPTTDAAHAPPHR